ncbi:hypothetical protein [His 1 virus]|uniref:Putative transmembrane protein ORF13 n=1 Tax=His1 virus (isolate Australia/Victoria) TaxID=654912 RepID=Y013_HIS1I|nr:hypothetical protein His1V_gp13 [His 1 virus]Q25BI2.1 RecName: Full=Putative transmembrane protein ORF13 [His1 virus (isolate Victoria)]AAQ13728.1 hypothetical protein [His 1 virus]
MNYWHSAIATFGIGDTVTTIIGLSMAGIYEANPAANTILGELGLFGIIAAKVLYFGLMYIIVKSMPEHSRKYGPITITVLGTLICLWNIAIIATQVLGF